MSKKILVVDDEEILIKTMNRLLEKQGYQVYTAKNGVDAQVLIEEESFDLIISDIRMPGQNGIETIKSIQEFLRNKKDEIPVIFITGFADEKMENEAKKLKPIAYLTKPFDTKELIQIIQQNIGVS